jgi:hypothetical protein
MALNMLQTSLLALTVLVFFIQCASHEDVSNGFAAAVVGLLILSATTAFVSSIFLIWAN